MSGDLFEETGDSFSEFQIPDVPSDGPVPVEPARVLGEKNQANPKVGATWSLKSGTTLRAAWFKTLKRTLITDQTLEPTQVAGFNQFFDDPSATQSRGVRGGHRPEVRQEGVRRRRVLAARSDHPPEPAAGRRHLDRDRAGRGRA